MLQRVVQLAVENGYDSAEYECTWNGYRVYTPVFNDPDLCYIGAPDIILEKDGMIRFGTAEETSAYIEFRTPKLSKKIIAKCMKILNGTA